MKCTKCGYDDKGSGDMAHICEPVNTPQRTWAGLTDEEIQTIAFDSADRESAIIKAEAKLKEKNT